MHPCHSISLTQLFRMLLKARWDSHRLLQRLQRSRQIERREKTVHLFVECFQSRDNTSVNKLITTSFVNGGSHMDRERHKSREQGRTKFSLVSEKLVWIRNLRRSPGNGHVRSV